MASGLQCADGLTNDELFALGYYYDISDWGFQVYLGDLTLEDPSDRMTRIAYVNFGSFVEYGYCIEEARKTAITHYVKTRLGGT